MARTPAGCPEMRASSYAPWGAAYLPGESGFEGDRVEVAIDLFYIFEMRRPVPGNERPDEHGSGRTERWSWLRRSRSWLPLAALSAHQRADFALIWTVETETNLNEV